MADYKRMISYMYQYENGVKRRNVGYARIEGKNGQLKITLHMQLLGQLDSIFPTYLIQRDKHNMELIYLGDSVLKGQMLDSKLVTDENNIMNSGYSLADMGGLLIFLNENVFYATVWDDNQIEAKEVMDALKPKNKTEMFAQRQNKKETTEEPKALEAKAETKEVFQEKAKTVQTNTKIEESNHEIEDYISGLTIEEQLAIPKYQLPRGWKTVERLHRPTQKTEERGISPSEFFNIPEMTPTQDINDLFFQPNQSETSNLQNAKKEEERETAKREAAERKAAERETAERKAAERETAEREAVEREAAERELEERRAAEREPVERRAAERESAERETKEREATERRGTDNPQFSNQRPSQDDWGTGKNGSVGSGQQGQMPQQEHPTAKYFFDHFTRIYPFEDNEIIFCVKIEPKDIGMLPKENWSLSNNSFLMHGFYCYHHLIFAKRKDGFGSQYIIGIPGIYHNRERFMAKMFGFENFKSIRRRELQMGDFGYWYLPINLTHQKD